MKVSEIPKKRIEELNKGLSATTNLIEWLAVDQAKLLLSVAEQHNLEALVKIQSTLPTVSVPKQIAWIGNQVSELKNPEVLEEHVSDLVRSWACYARVAKSKNLKQALAAIKSFAEDIHFGIREIAWMSVREQICENPK